MSQEKSDVLFRRAAELENGEPVSAGLRVSHLQASIGRIYPIDLSTVPENRRAAVVAEIQRLIERENHTAG